MKFNVYQISRKGGREKNEDRMGYCYTNSSGIFLLADGMGGHPEGEVAAQIALQTISGLYQKEAQPELADVKQFFTTAILAAHNQILQYANDRKLTDTPRTTLVLAVVQGGNAYWAHCGDSRLYFVRQGELLMRTRDHSYLERRRDTRRASPDNLNRNVLFTCLGSPSTPNVDVAAAMPLQQGDKILLCSDGLWGNLDDLDIVYHVGQMPVADAAPELVERALIKGGPTSDNVTLVMVEWETPDTFETTHGAVLTQSGEDGAFASTVQTSWADSKATDLNDEDIERNIAEIKDAIKRTALRRA